MMTDLAVITIALIMKWNVGFRIAYLSLTFAYSKGQLGSWKGVSSNILAFLFKITMWLVTNVTHNKNWS